MIVYSNKIIRFVNEIKSSVKTILSKELCLKNSRERFFDRRQEASYPIRVVIYNNKSMLGYFDSEFYELGFHECLMHASREQLNNVIRHELAHYMIFIEYGQGIQPHGAVFRAFCQQMGWGEEVYKATCMVSECHTSEEETSIFRKVKKLMALATSSNKNEAEQAMIKSQQLLLKHNIEYMGGEDDEKVFLKRIMKQKKASAKMRSIAIILETFFVSTVYRRTGDFIYLEILGSAVNIEIAEYVASILDYELDKFWNHAQNYANLKGTIAKNSFFLGLAKGYCNKIQALKREYNSEVTHALMVVEKKLIDAKAMAYERLSSAKSRANYCSKSSSLGEQMGRQLNIKSAINNSSNCSKAEIAYSG
ncbi:MAG: SprT-like domain-containing protein [Parachlamydia sp.]|nr:SprT-like domain-containing protein [Parachlamydia sp.]